MKTYYFSVQKHAHDIEFYRNRLKNTLGDMENGTIPMDSARYDRIWNLLNGELEDLYMMMFESRDGKTVQLTGKQLTLAKKIVAWASEQRASTLIENGKYEYLQHC